MGTPHLGGGPVVPALPTPHKPERSQDPRPGPASLHNDRGRDFPTSRGHYVSQCAHTNKYQDFYSPHFVQPALSPRGSSGPFIYS